MYKNLCQRCSHLHIASARFDDKLLKLLMTFINLKIKIVVTLLHLTVEGVEQTPRLIAVCIRMEYEFDIRLRGLQCCLNTFCLQQKLTSLRDERPSRRNT